MSKRFKTREAAALIGVAENTLANAESGPYAVLGTKRVDAFVAAMGLDRTSALRLRELYAACPVSPFQQKRAERWAKHRADREVLKDAKSLHAELLLLRDRVAKTAPVEAAFVRLLELHVLDGDGCDCAADHDPTVPDADHFVCELCQSMRALGIVAGWVDAKVAGAALLAAFPDAPEQSTGGDQPVDNGAGDLEDDFG